MKRVISFLLSIVMVISMLPVSVFATDIQPEEATTPGSAFTAADAAEPAPSESEPAPSESEPAPSESEPASSESEPAPSESEPAPGESEPAPGESEPAPGESEPAPSESEPAPGESEPASDEEEQLWVDTVTRTAASTVSVGDSEELLDGFVYNLFYGDGISAYGNAAGNRLSGVTKDLYDCLKNGIEGIVSGEDDVCSTVFSLSGDVLQEWGANLSVSPVAGTEAERDAQADAIMDQFDFQAIVDALLYDCAYELFWFDKTNTAPVGMSYGYSYSSTSLTVTNLTVSFQVVQDMQPASYDAANPTVDVSKAVNAQEALANAQDILSAYQNSSDYEKLHAFKNEICARVSYDFGALETGVFSLDADPWQLISVFDDSTDTNVVCEGYSKAFQYLCERSGLETYIVTGYMDNDPEAGHMWNVVTLDGRNYLADVTNTDDGMSGQDGSLFLNGYDAGSLEAGYVFNTQSVEGINTFTYDTDTLNFWGAEILTLSDQDYTVPGDEGGEDGGEVDVNDWSCGENLLWAYDEDTGTLTISGTGAMTDYSTGGQPWTSVLSKIRHLVIQDGVTEISKKAFHSLDALEKITVPGELETWNCITIPASAPYSTMVLTGKTVAPCDASTTGYMPGRNAANVVISEGITVISKGAFVNCDQVKNLTLPDTLQTIGESAFMQNTSLQTLSVPGNVTELQTGAFAGCTGLTTVIFNGDAPEIGDYAFFDVEATVGYPGANETWTADVMQNYQGSLIWRPYFKTLASGTCGSTMSYNLKDDGVLTLSGYGDMASYAIEMAPWCADELYPYVKRVVVEEGITGIGHTAFAGCTALEEISFASTVTTIGDQAFYGCVALKNIAFTGNAPAIGENAFYGVEATVTYPVTNTTWTEEYLQNYGGTLAWTAVRLTMSQEDFHTAVSEAEGTYVLTRDVTITGDYVMNRPVTVAKNAILTVAEGGHLGIDEAAWTVEGVLINNGTMDLVGGAVMTIAQGSYGNENNGTFHVGMNDDQIGTLEIEGLFGGSGYLCVQPAGILNIYEGTCLSIIAKDGKEGFLQCNGTVNVYGSLDIATQLVVDSTCEMAATLNITEDGMMYNYPGACSTIEADGVFNLDGEMYNASSFVVMGTATITGAMYAMEDGDLHIEGSGSVINNGTIESDVYVGYNAELTGSGVVTGEVYKVDRTSHDWFVQQLKNARDGYLWIDRDVVLVEDLTIPGSVGNVTFQGSLTIPMGVTLTSYASMGFKNELHVEKGGSLNLMNDNTSVDVNEDGWLLSWAEGGNPVNIDGALTIGEGASLCVHNDVTVSAGGAVTVDGVLSLEAYSYGGSTWNVDGTMRINGGMSVHQKNANEFSVLNLNEGSTFIASRNAYVIAGGALYVNGTVKNSGWLEVNNGGELILGQNGHLTNDNHLFFNQAKTVVVNGTLVNDLVEGQFENGQGIHLIETGMEIYGTLTSSNDIYVEGGSEKPLIIKKDGELSLVPKGENYYGALYLYENCSVEVLGDLTNNGLIVNWGGTIWVDEDGTFVHNADAENYGNIHVGMRQGGRIEINSNLFNEGYLCVHPQGTLDIQENGILYNHYVNTNAGGYLDAYGTVNVFDRGLIENEYLVTVDGAMTIHQGGEVHNYQVKSGSDYGTMIINESGKLTVNGRLSNECVFVNFGKETIINGGELYVGPTGHLINNGEMNLRDAVATVDGTLTNGDENAPDEMAMQVNYGTDLTVNGKLINNRNIHVGLEPGRNAVLNVADTLTNNAYICVHPAGVLHVGAEAELTNTFKEGVNTGFLQVNGEVVVDGVINNSFLIVVGAETETTEEGTSGQTGVLTIGSSGIVNNKYVNPELAEISIIPNGKLNLEGKIKNDSRIINAGVIQAKESGVIVSGAKAVFENEGDLVMGEEAEPFNVAIQSEAEELTVPAKKTLKLNALLLPGNVTNTKVVWRVSDPMLATLKTSGNSVTLTAADVSEPCTVILTAASADGLAEEDSVTVHIIPEAKRITIYQYDYNVSEWDALYYSNVTIGFRTELTASVEPAGASADVIWSSDNDKVAYIADETKGTITFTGAEGTVKITATSVSNSKVKASVIYKLAAPVSIETKDNAVVDASGNRVIELVAGKSETLQILNKDTRKEMSVQWGFGFMKDDIWHDTSLDDAMYATINSSGKLTAKKIFGYQELTLRGLVMKNDVPVDEIFYTVKIYPATVYVDIQDGDQVVNGQTLYLDQSNTAGLNLNAVVYPVDAKSDISWTSSNDDIATVDKNGVVKSGSKTGTVTITATNKHGSKKKATVKVEVGALTTNVTITNAPATLTSGASVTLKADTTPEEPTKAGVTWKITEGEAFAKIASSGKLTAKAVTAPQIVKVVAVSKDAAKIESAPVQITILPKTAENLNLLSLSDEEPVNVTKATLNAEIGDVFTIASNKFFAEDLPGELWGVTWSVNGGDVKLTDVSGAELVKDQTYDTIKITVEGTGKTKITATGYTSLNKKVTTTVTINAGVLSDGVKELSGNTDIMVASGKSITLKAAAYNNDGLKLSNSKLTWSLAPGDEAYAKISTSGKLTAVKNLNTRQEIKVIVTAQDGNSQPLEIPVTITPLAQSVELIMNHKVQNADGTALTYHYPATGQNWLWPIFPGEEVSMEAKVYPVEGSVELWANQSVEWKSSNEKIVHIDPETGVMTFGEKTGSVTITATAQDGSKKKATIKLTVIRPVLDLEIHDGSVVGGKTLKLDTLTEFITPDATSKKLVYEVIGGDGAAFVNLSKNQLKTSKVTGVKEVQIRAYDEYYTIFKEFSVFIRPSTTQINLTQPEETAVVTELPQDQVLRIAADSLPDYALPFEECYTWKVSNAKQGGFVTETGELTGSIVAPYVDLKGITPGSTLTITATAMDGSGVKGTMKIKIVDPVIYD